MRKAAILIFCKRRETFVTHMIKKPLNSVWSKAETDEIGHDTAVFTFSVWSTEPNMCPKMKQTCWSFRQLWCWWLYHGRSSQISQSVASAFENTRQVAVWDEVIIPAPQRDGVYFIVELLIVVWRREMQLKTVPVTADAKNLVDDFCITRENVCISAQNEK